MFVDATMHIARLESGICFMFEQKTELVYFDMDLDIYERTLSIHQWVHLLLSHAIDTMHNRWMHYMDKPIY